MSGRGGFWKNYRALRGMRRLGCSHAQLRVLRDGVFGPAYIIASALQSALEKDPQLLSSLAGNRVSDSDIQRLHHEGLEAGEIAARLMVPWQRVQAALRQGRVEAEQDNACADVMASVDQPDAVASVLRIKQTIAERRADVARLTGQGVDAVEIATQLGVSRATVWNDRAALGLPAGKRGSEPDPDVADRRAAIVADVNAGMRYEDVAAKHKCSVSNVKIAVYRARKTGQTVKVTRSAGPDPARRDAVMSALLAGLSWAETVRSLKDVHAGITRDVVAGIVKAATPEERNQIDAAVAARKTKGKPEKPPRPEKVKAPAPLRVERVVAPKAALPKKPVAARPVRSFRPSPAAPVAKPMVEDRAPRVAAPTERQERQRIADTSFGPDTSYLGQTAIMACRDGKCRWPVGDPASPMFRMCLAVTEPTLVYCTAHSALARVPGSAAKIKAYDPMVVTVSRARNDFASVDQVMR